MQLEDALHAAMLVQLVWTSRLSASRIMAMQLREHVVRKKC